MLALLPELQSAALNLGVALVCGALIGTERQARKRTAGLRTNALVAIGAAAFVIFAARFTGEASPTRVAAQVVSGIGFLGAGIIFRDGFNVHGLNTAATLWCSAAVGLLAGTSAWHLAALLTGFVVFVNLGLRPLVKLLKRKTGAETRPRREFHITLRCRSDHEAASRNLVAQAFAASPLAIISIATQGLRRPGPDGTRRDRRRRSGLARRHGCPHAQARGRTGPSPAALAGGCRRLMTGGHPRKSLTHPSCRIAACLAGDFP
jgi:putative Mg2+ transporter-C (MgtC) family protein